MLYKNIWEIKKHLYKNGVLNNKMLDVYDAFFARHGAWVGSHCQLIDKPCFPHGYFGIFISGGAKIGKNVVIFHHVTIGSNTLDGHESSGSPTIGDNVYIGAGAKIIGEVTIGDNCRVGANAVVYQNMPANSVAVQSPTRIIQKENLDNRFISYQSGKLVYYKDGEWVKMVESAGE